MRMSPTRQRMKLIWRLTVALVLSLCVIAGLIIAIVAQHEASHTAKCVNDTLGDRNGTSATDAAAHVQFADALQHVLLAPKAHQPVAYRQFLAELDHYVSTLRTDQRYRDAHPLGKC